MVLGRVAVWTGVDWCGLFGLRGGAPRRGRRPWGQPMRGGVSRGCLCLSKNGRIWSGPWRIILLRLRGAFQVPHVWRRCRNGRGRELVSRWRGRVGGGADAGWTVDDQRLGGVGLGVKAGEEKVA